MATEMLKKVVECRTCLNAGHSGQMIGFINTGKVATNGKVIWSLRNEDMSLQKVAIPDMVEQVIKPDLTEHKTIGDLTNAKQQGFAALMPQNQG